MLPSIGDYSPNAIFLAYPLAGVPTAPLLSRFDFHRQLARETMPARELMQARTTVKKFFEKLPLEL